MSSFPLCPFSPVAAAAREWQAAIAPRLEASDKRALIELFRRLERLDRQYAQLMTINANLAQAKIPTSHFNPATGEVQLRLGQEVLSRYKLNRANAEVPIEVSGSSSIYAYPAETNHHEESPDEHQMKHVLEEQLEQYYYGAHRVLKIAQKLPGLRNLKCNEIVIVRNKLIEHADHGDLYSFGVGSSGPVVKPLACGARIWTDAGLIHNTQAFSAQLSAAFLVPPAR